MTRFNRAEVVPENRRQEVFLYEDDGVTPVDLSTNFVGSMAKRQLLGLSGGTLLDATISVDIGLAGNDYTIEFVADGVGAGNVTTSGGGLVVQYHFQTGVSTVAQAKAALLSVNLTLTTTALNTATLTASDVFGPFKLAGGTDSDLFLRRGDVTWVTFGGTFTNTGIDGDWVYEYTQAELDFAGNQVSLRVTKPPRPAKLLLIRYTVNCETIVYDKFSTGADGNSTTLAFVADGAGTGTLDESGYPAIVFHYASGVTTVGDFETAVEASTKLGIFAYGNWSLALTDPDDTFTAAALSSGMSYKQEIFPADMNTPSTTIIEDGHTSDEIQRLILALLCGPASDFRTSTVEVKSLDGTKTRGTLTFDDAGRASFTYGDLT